jgi:hypothetical protein
MESERPLVQRLSDPWPKTPETPGQRTPALISLMRRADPDTARAFLAPWLKTYPRNGTLYGHLSWDFALGELEARNAAAALQLFREAFAPDVHSGPPRGKLNDAVAFLWRWELAGHPRDRGARTGSG